MNSIPPPPKKKPLSKISQPTPPPLKNLNTPPTPTHTKFNIPNPPPPPPPHTQNSTSPGRLDTNSTTQIYIDPSTEKIKPRSYIIGDLYPPPPSQKY